MYCAALATGKPGLPKSSFDSIFYADKEYYVFIHLINNIKQILVGIELKCIKNWLVTGHCLKHCHKRDPEKQSLRESLWILGWTRVAFEKQFHWRREPELGGSEWVAVKKWKQ